MVHRPASSYDDAASTASSYYATRDSYRGAQAAAEDKPSSALMRIVYSAVSAAMVAVRQVRKAGSLLSLVASLVAWVTGCCLSVARSITSFQASMAACAAACAALVAAAGYGMLFALAMTRHYTSMELHITRPLAFDYTNPVAVATAALVKPPQPPTVLAALLARFTPFKQQGTGAGVGQEAAHHPYQQYAAQQPYSQPPPSPYQQPYGYQQQRQPYYQPQHQPPYHQQQHQHAPQHPPYQQPHAAAPGQQHPGPDVRQARDQQQHHQYGGVGQQHQQPPGQQGAWKQPGQEPYPQQHQQQQPYAQQHPYQHQQPYQQQYHYQQPHQPHQQHPEQPPPSGKPAVSAASLQERVLPGGQQVSVSVVLELPPDHTDLFQLTGELLAPDGRLLARTTRTHMPRRGQGMPLIKMAKRVMLAPLYLLGLMGQETNTITIRLFDSYSERPDLPLAAFRALLASRNATAGVLPPPPVYTAQLRLSLKLGIFRTLLYWLRPGWLLSITVAAAAAATALGGTAVALAFSLLAITLHRVATAGTRAAAKAAEAPVAPGARRTHLLHAPPYGAAKGAAGLTGRVPTLTYPTAADVAGYSEDSEWGGEGEEGVDAVSTDGDGHVMPDDVTEPHDDEDELAREVALDGEEVTNGLGAGGTGGSGLWRRRGWQHEAQPRVGGAAGNGGSGGAPRSSLSSVIAAAAKNGSSSGINAGAAAGGKQGAEKQGGAADADVADSAPGTSAEPAPRGDTDSSWGGDSSVGAAAEGSPTPAPAATPGGEQQEEEQEEEQEEHADNVGADGADVEEGAHEDVGRGSDGADVAPRARARGGGSVKGSQGELGAARGAPDVQQSADTGADDNM